MRALHWHEYDCSKLPLKHVPILVWLAEWEAITKRFWVPEMCLESAFYLTFTVFSCSLICYKLKVKAHNEWISFQEGSGKSKKKKEKKSKKKKEKKKKAKKEKKSEAEDASSDSSEVSYPATMALVSKPMKFFFFFKFDQIEQLYFKFQ